MKFLGGSSLILTAIVFILIGLVLRMGIIDWLIDATGFILIVVGIIMGIFGVINLFKGGRRSY